MVRAHSLCRELSRRLSILTIAVVFAASAISLVVTMVHFQNGLRPVLLQKAGIVANSVARDIEYALEIGIPFDELRGVDAHITEVLTEYPELESLELIPAGRAEGDVIVARPDDGTGDGAMTARLSRFLGDVASILPGASAASIETTAIAVRADGEIVGWLRSGIDRAFIADQMVNVFFDAMVVLLAVALIALEVVVVLTADKVTAPLRRVDDALDKARHDDFSQSPETGERGPAGRFVAHLNALNTALGDRARDLARRLPQSRGDLAERLAGLRAAHRLDEADPPRNAAILDARIPLFIFCFAEELQKSFLPLFVGEYYGPGDLFSREVMVGLPISAFMFVIAAVTPFAGSLIDRFGSRRLFLAGLVPAIAGYLGCYLATSADHIVIARSVTALGYAVITISCQSYIAAVLTKGNRARGMAVFVGVLMTATMCGTAIGAILSDWLGYKPVFLVASVLAGVAGIAGLLMLRRDAGGEAAADAPLNGSMLSLFANTHFVLLVVLCAIPAKIILTGFLYLFVPIYLASLEASQSEIGRIMMLYSLIIIPVSPIASRIADRLGRNLEVVIGATIVSGLVLMVLLQSATVAGILVSVAALGLVHAFLKAPLIVTVMDAAEQSDGVSRTAAMSLLRTSERVGSVVGPVAVAALLVVLDFNQAAALLGAGVALAGIGMALLTLIRPREAANA